MIPVWAAQVCLAAIALSVTPTAIAQVDLITTVVEIQGAEAATDSTATVATGSVVTIVFTVEHGSGTAFLGGDEFNTTAGVPPAQASILRKQTMSSNSANVPCSLAGCTGRIDTGETVTFTVTFLGESPGATELTIHSAPNLRTDTNPNNNTRTMDVEVVDAAAADLGIQITDIVGVLEFDPVPPKQARMNAGDAVSIFVLVYNDGPDSADSIVITGGTDSTFFQINSAVALPSVTCEVGAGGDFFSCADLTLPVNDTVTVVASGHAIAPSFGTDFSVSTGHPAESNFGNNDDIVTLVIDPMTGTNSVSGFVFLDLNADGIIDGGDEVGLPGRVMFADMDANGLLDAAIDLTDTTDIDGSFILEDIALDSVSVGLVPIENWDFTVPADGFQLVDFEDGPNQDNVNQGTRPRPGSIRGAKWKDLNQDGVLNPGEPLLPGWTIYLDQNDNDMLDPGERSELTDANGLYAFGNLSPGTYTVREVQQGGFMTTFPSAGKHTVTVAQGQFVGGRSFGNRPVSSIHGEKYEDLNGNGQRDEGEPGIDDVEILLLDRDTGIEVARTTSMAVDISPSVVERGVFWFEDVPPGIYQLVELVPDGFDTTEPPESQGPFGPWHAHNVVLPEATELTGFRFGNQPVSDLSVTKEHRTIEGDRFFVITVAATGESPNAVVLDTLDADVELLDFSSSKGTCSYDPATRVFRCELGTVRPGQEIEIRLHVRHASDPTGSLRNSATVSSDAMDLFPDNDEADVSGGPRVSQFEKTATADSVDIGETITYTISVVTFGDTIVSDTLSSDLDFVSVRAVSLTCRYDESARAVVCETTEFKTGEYMIIVEAVARVAGVIPNVATITTSSIDLLVTDTRTDTALVVVRDPATVSTDPDDSLPARFEVRGHHPNPFAAQTTIRVDLPIRSVVRVDVFDILGRHVLAVPERELPAGWDRLVQIDASGLTSGVYFYRLQAGDRVETKRMVVVK